MRSAHLVSYSTLSVKLLVAVFFLLVILVLVLLPQHFSFRHSLASAQTTQTSDTNNGDTSNVDLDQKRRKVEELQRKLQEIEGEKISLSTTIQYINTKISLSQAEIDKSQAELESLENEVELLSTRIGGLEQSLDVLSNVLIEHMVDHYKNKQAHPVTSLILSQNLTTFVRQQKYNKIAQEKTRAFMEQAESQRQLFDQQKHLKEEKQLEVEKKREQLGLQKLQLASERNAQQQLLQDTKNNEAQYQAELQRTLGEIQAIQGIIAGRGNETKVRNVSAGDTIANIILGASPCSNGTHLHFEVVKNSVHQNPASYLSQIPALWDNSPDGPFGFSGNWQWPMNNPAKINQGFGMTYYARDRRAYGGAPHTGIDMASKTAGDTTVRAVKDGELYRGGISCGGRTLQYVRVIHSDDTSISTYYLHVNY